MSGSGEYISHEAAFALVKRLRAAAKEWCKKNKVVGVGETRYDFALDEAANVIGELSFDLQRMQELNIALYGALPRWIPVTERLPKEYVNVLCHLRSLDRQSEYYGIDHLMEDGQWWKAANSWKHEVTHWMPLPEPPKEEV